MTKLQEHLRSFQNQLSGYLLRKFKNSNGWQKLWVVFTNFCLFFYKTFQVSCGTMQVILLGSKTTKQSIHRQDQGCIEIEQM